MKKETLSKLAVSVFVIVAATVTVLVNRPPKEELSSLLLANIEALAQGENPMDSQIWTVQAENSTHWLCTNGGSSACPAP